MDRGRQHDKDDSISGKSAREEHIRVELPRVARTMRSGGKVDPKNWYSFMKGMQERDRDLHSLGLVLSTLCLDKGWALAVEDIQASATKSVFGEPDVSPSATAAKRKRDANEAIKRIKQKAVNQVHAVLRLLEDPEIISGMRIIAIGLSVWSREFTKAARDFSSTEGCCRFLNTRVQQQVAVKISKSFIALSETHELERAGFTCAADAAKLAKQTTSDANVLAQDCKANALWHLLWRCASNRAGSDAWYYLYYPGRFAGFTSIDTFSETMAKFRHSVDAWHWCKDLETRYWCKDSFKCHGFQSNPLGHK